MFEQMGIPFYKVAKLKVNLGLQGQILEVAMGYFENLKFPFMCQHKYKNQFIR